MMKVAEDLSWEEISQHLKKIPGYTPSEKGKAEKLTTKGESDDDVSNRMFFKVEYESDDIIMPQGVCTDFAGLLLEGSVRVVDVPAINQVLARQQESVECWRPRTRLSKWFARVRGKRPVSAGALADPLSYESLDDTNSTYIGRRKARDYKGDEDYKDSEDDDGTGQLRPALKRFMGLTGAMWNIPRTYTLIAENDRMGKPCTLLLIKREVLLIINKKSQKFREQRKQFFLERELPGRLLSNRLFANTLYPDNITDWPQFVAKLKEPSRCQQIWAVQRIRSHWDGEFRDWFDGLGEQALGDYEKYEILRGLNTFLRNDGLYDEVAWSGSKLSDDDVAPLLGIAPQKRTRNQIIQLNRLLYHAALPNELRQTKKPEPLSRDEFHQFVEAIRTASTSPESGESVPEDEGIRLEHYDPDKVIYCENTPSSGLYLLLSGRVKVTRNEVLLNHFGQDGYFGLSCLQGEDAVHTATVTAMSQVDLVFLHCTVVLQLQRQFPFLKHKLECEQARIRSRELLRRPPPVEPPERLAPKLMAATNLLLIDMDLCTRCDKCVQACEDAHDGVGRFQRSNPDLRFGKWEVAGACVHCENPPCQKACPVGAITIEFGEKIVQVHRNRCIGCGACERKCPFDVISMVAPLQIDNPLPVAGVDKNGVATKCDLCLTDTHDPPCVTACPYGAAQRGTPRDLFPGIKSWSQPIATEQHLQTDGKIT